jgi:Fe-S-cluster containining protein
MSQDARRAKRAGKIVLQLYRDNASYVADSAEQLGVTCKPGCAHCCMLPATATLPEMVLVVEYLTSRSDWEKRRPALERELIRQLTAFAGVDILDPRSREAFFTRQLPCTFLTADKRCSIYDVRPAVCRYHMVVSPPENCAHVGEFVKVDLQALETQVAVDGAKALGELTGGPIALVFVLAAKALGVALDIDPALIRGVQTVRVDVLKPAMQLP